MWLRKEDKLVLVPERMLDTITRCLQDGWVEAPDPRVVPAQAATTDAQPSTEATLEPELVQRSPLPPLDLPVVPTPVAPRGRGRRDI